VSIFDKEDTVLKIAVPSFTEQPVKTPCSWFRPSDFFRTTRHCGTIFQVLENGTCKPILVKYGRRVYRLVEE